MKIQTLGWLLFNANSGCKSPEFYALKREILERFGLSDGFDIQFIDGKKCWTCAGTGKFDTHSSCYHCNKGWYKEPFYSILERRILGDYTFHLPIKKSFKSGGITPNIIGYIEHEPTNCSTECLELLFELKHAGILFNLT